MTPGILSDDAFVVPTPDSGTSVLPSPVKGPLVWSGATLNNDTYTLKLDKNDVEEIESALREFKSMKPYSYI